MSYPKRGMLTSKLETINESSPLVVAENNNNSDDLCELGNCSTRYSTKKMFDRTFSYTMCLGSVVIVAMFGLVMLAQSYGSNGRHSFSPFFPDAVNGSDTNSTTINIHTLPI